MHTKLALGNSLKQLVLEKPFEKISVSDITNKCGLNRQTFYYHFQDKYECLEWVYRHDCLEPLIQSSNLNNWNRCIERMMTIMLENKEFYIRTINADPKTFINTFFEVSKTLFQRLIHHIDNEDYVDDEEEVFISEFLTQGIVGTITSWVAKGMRIPPHELAERLRQMAIGIDQLVIQRKFKIK